MGREPNPTWAVMITKILTFPSSMRVIWDKNKFATHAVSNNDFLARSPTAREHTGVSCSGRSCPGSQVSIEMVLPSIYYLVVT